MTPRRADAERNCEKILEAARDAFATCDSERDVSMAELARRAGVGMGTLYRNFANRRELLEALYAHEVDGVCQAAQTVEGATPGARLATWLDRFFAFFSTKRQFAAALLEGVDCSDSVFGDSRARVVAAGQPLLAAAQEAGEVRQELTLEQVLDMVGAIATIPADCSYVRPILDAALDGLRPPG
ncbi:MAG: transcriptional regulator, TetR family [Actinomycetia bacterium]|nr:transcriptional regulator, TetR family [Actinomycetes bacterium]